MKKLFGLLIILFISTSLFAIDNTYINLGDDFADTMIKLRRDGYSYVYKDDAWEFSKSGEKFCGIPLSVIYIKSVGDIVSSVDYQLNCNTYEDICTLYNLFIQSVYKTGELITSYNTYGDAFNKITKYFAYNEMTASSLIIGEATTHVPGHCSFGFCFMPH